MLFGVRCSALCVVRCLCLVVDWLLFVVCVLCVVLGVWGGLFGYCLLVVACCLLFVVCCCLSFVVCCVLFVCSSLSLAVDR